MAKDNASGMKKKGYVVAAAIVLFFLFFLLLSLWIRPYYEQTQQEKPYVSPAFTRCIQQKAGDIVPSISRYGGYLSPQPGIAHELTIARNMEMLMTEALPICETLLQQEEEFKRQLGHVSVAIGPKEVIVFFDGKWVSNSGKTIPGFAVHLNVPLGDLVAFAEETRYALEDIDLAKKIILPQIINNQTLKQSIYRNLQMQDVTFDLKQEQITHKNGVSFPLLVKVTRDNGTFQFIYPVMLGEQ